MLLCVAEASTELMQSMKARIQTRMTHFLLVAGWRHDAFHTPTSSSGAAEVLQGVCDRAKMVADALGLNGVAQLDAFMHADSADLVVVNTHAIPDMSASSDIFQQWENTTVMQMSEVRT